MSISDFKSWLYLHSDKNPELLEAIGKITDVIFESTEDVVKNAKDILGETAPTETDPLLVDMKNPTGDEGFEEIEEGFDD